jgi:hypothetical protein
MRYMYLTCAGCLAVLLLGIGFVLVYDRADDDLVLPGASDVQLNGPVLARQQQITYRLPPDRSPSHIFVHLEHYGWSRDRRAEQMLGRDRMDHTTPMVFTRQRLLGMLSEIALVQGSLNDSNSVEIQIFRCFRIHSQLGCL